MFQLLIAIKADFSRILRMIGQNQRTKFVNFKPGFLQSKNQCSRVCQCAKSLKCSVFQAFSNTLDLNVHKNAKKFGRYFRLRVERS